MPKDADTAYLALAQDLRHRILRGEFTAEQLPTESDLAVRYGVSRQTVRRAFQDLVAEGMVYRVPGKGTFAGSLQSGHLRQVGRLEDVVSFHLSSNFELLSPLRVSVNIDAAARLGLGSDLVANLFFRRTVDGVPYAATRVYLSPEIGERLAEVAPEVTERMTTSITVHGLLESRLGIVAEEAVQSITATRADALVAKSLDCAEGATVLRTQRLFRRSSGEAIELVDRATHPERYSYRVRLWRNSGD